MNRHQFESLFGIIQRLSILRVTESHQGASARLIPQNAFTPLYGLLLSRKHGQGYGEIQADHIIKHPYKIMGHFSDSQLVTIDRTYFSHKDYILSLDTNSGIDLIAPELVY